MGLLIESHGIQPYGIRCDFGTGGTGRQLKAVLFIVLCVEGDGVGNDSRKIEVPQHVYQLITNGLFFCPDVWLWSIWIEGLFKND